jgi:adenine-specific DNA-methyltransferase
VAKKKTKKSTTKKKVDTLTHDEAKRKNIPTAEFQSVMRKDEQTPIRVAYDRRNRDLDPQLVWRGKDEQDWSDLVVQAPPLFIQEKVHPKALIDDLTRRSEAAEAKRAAQQPGFQTDLFADFNGIPDDDAKTEFYQHEANWANRLILGDSLQVMASLAEREGLRGQVQCVYIDPPYGIGFNSNFQWSTTSRDVRDGKVEHITREPEQVRAFRDTWRDGIHSYLTYLRDRLTVARDLLAPSGSVFIQIGDENAHRVRALLDEVFGADNFAATITFRKKMMPLGSDVAEGVSDYILWYAKDRKSVKSRSLFQEKEAEGESVWGNARLPTGERIKLTKEQRDNHSLLPDGAQVYQAISLLPAQYRKNQDFVFEFEGKQWDPPKKNSWKTDATGMGRLKLAGRLHPSSSSLRYVLLHADYPVSRVTNLWADASGATQQVYVVQTNTDVVKRCLLMASDPGDLVLDPTCGSGTTAYVAEQWGRRWITIDTSRVALALARARLMGSRFPYYLLTDSPEGQRKEAELSRAEQSTRPTRGSVRQGFVYERVPHITMGSIGGNTEIDVLWEKHQQILEPIRSALNKTLGCSWEEWEIPRAASKEWPGDAQESHAAWWNALRNRQSEIDASIAAKAEYEYLYDSPYQDKKVVRVSGPFTVESLSPHRSLAVDENDELIDPARSPSQEAGADFTQVILEHLKTSGAQQAKKDFKVDFVSITPWPGEFVCAEGRFVRKASEGSEEEGRAAIFVGPEFGTVGRQDLVAAAREAGDGDFDVLVACAFNFEAHATEFSKLGRIRILKARMNADLHMADDLKNTGKGNLFVIFGEPDVEIVEEDDGRLRVQIVGMDVFDPSTGEIRSDEAKDIACWFIDTDYNEEAFFVRHAYFLGASDPYRALKRSLKEEISLEAWGSLNSDISRPFRKPASGRIAVKVINHLGDEVMKVFRVE